MADDYEITGFVGDFVFENEIKIPVLSLKNVTVNGLDLRTKNGCDIAKINSFIDKMHGVLLSRTIEQNYASNLNPKSGIDSIFMLALPFKQKSCCRFA